LYREIDRKPFPYTVRSRLGMRVFLKMPIPELDIDVEED
jgi:hypothetical protein